MQKNKVIHPFPPYYEKDAKILILGSMPSVESRKQNFYYMHPKNRFWKVLSQVFQEKYPESLEDKKHFLTKYQIALWDVIASCQIRGSSDSSITQVKVNPIAKIVKEAKIEKIYTIGKKAFQLYQKHLAPEVGLDAIFLPSTSPANAIFSMEHLVKEYQILKGEEVT